MAIDIFEAAKRWNARNASPKQNMFSNTLAIMQFIDSEKDEVQKDLKGDTILLNSLIDGSKTQAELDSLKIPLKYPY